MTDVIASFARSPQSVIVCVGSRRPDHRRLFKLGLFSLGLTVGIMPVAVHEYAALNGWVGRTVAHMETRQAHARVPGTFTDSVGFTTLLTGEDAWSMGNPAAAAYQWLAHTARPENHQDLEVAGWALRAAIKADQPDLIAAAVQRWNTVRQALPLDIIPSVPALPRLTDGHKIYAHVISAGVDQATTYQAWLDRAPVAAETLATLRQCNVEAGCSPSLPMDWKTLDGQVATQIRTWKNRGFTPQMAWDVYRERQMLGDSSHEISSRHHQSLTDIEQLRLTMQQRLDRVQTPADLPAYWAAWKTQAARMGAPMAWEGESGVVGGLWGLQVNWAHRLSGENDGWSAMAPAPEAAQWENLSNRLTAHLESQPVGEVPDHLTAADADRRLLQVIQQSGLRQLRWPAVFPDTPEVKWRLAGLIEKGNLALQQATGWEGPVLGQAGHVVLSLNAAASGVQVGLETIIPSQSTDQHNVMISTVMGGDSLGGLPHEWFHAHDSLLTLHKTAVATELSWASDKVAADLDMPLKALWVMTKPPLMRDETEAAMTHLWEGVRSPDLSVGQRVNAVLEGWVDQWTAIQPQYRAQWLGEAADVREHRWTAARSQARWGEVRPTPQARSQLVVLVAQSFQPPTFQSEQGDLSTSGWMQASRSAPSLTRDPSRPQDNSEENYWSVPTEMLARSFERQLASQGIVSTREQSAWIYYPQGAEKAWQEPVWRQYFQEQKGWWNRLRAGSVAPPLGRTLGQASRPITPGTPSPPR
jgi:hypothetical protein